PISSLPLLNVKRLHSLIPYRASRFRKPETTIFLIKASGNGVEAPNSSAAAAIKPGGVLESDKLPSDVRKRSMEAIDAFGRRVTLGDVASKAGLKLNEAQRALQAIAADADGYLEVSDEGDVLYTFPDDYRSKLASKSLRIKIEPLLEKGKRTAEYLTRVAFGTALVASIVLVYTTIIAIVSSSRDEDSRGRRGRPYGSGFTFYFSPTDLFWYWDPYYYRRRQMKEGDGGMNFIDSVFSFVFGDGDPNQGIEEERWKLIGEYITSNGGVVAAEELAPYLDLESTKDTDDESYILPVLLRFDGLPEVNEEGNILYRFPSLQRTASPQRVGRKEYVGRKRNYTVSSLEKFFKEKPWQFSETSASQKAMVIGLGGLNLFGVIILGSMMKVMTVSPSGFVSFVSSIFPLLQVYAGSFFAIPMLRWFSVRIKNDQIEKRNRAREEFARAVESPDLPLRRKLLSARDMAERTYVSKDRIVYSTERDLDYEQQDYDIREWDRRFKEIEKTD
ncbi:hypothetical protein M569_07252, partial [Genlisea aurea]